MPLTQRDTRKPVNAPLATDRTPQTRNQKGKLTEQQAKLNQMKETYVKYKTTMCRHWEQTQTCALGDACAFAHGGDEKRGINDVSNSPVINTQIWLARSRKFPGHGTSRCCP